VMTSQQRTALRSFYKGKKYLPLDLRPKQTRAKVSFLIYICLLVAKSSSKEGCTEDYVEDKEDYSELPCSEVRSSCIASIVNGGCTICELVVCQDLNELQWGRLLEVETEHKPCSPCILWRQRVAMLIHCCIHSPLYFPNKSTN
jgi:hypothetical protein